VAAAFARQLTFLEPFHEEHMLRVAILTAITLGLLTPGAGAAALQQTTNVLGVPRVVALGGAVSASIQGVRGPVAGASVDLEDLSRDVPQRVVASVVTDAQGTYAITNPQPALAEPTTYDVAPGRYELYASYRQKRVDAGAVTLAATETATRDIDLGVVVRAGGAPPPPPAVTFYATDRLAVPGAADVTSMFADTRLIDPCELPPDCMMSYGTAVPTGPVFGAPQPARTRAELVSAISARYPGAGSLLVYVHGYNNDFFDPFLLGATWLATIAKGAPVIVYSWPSNHATLKYLDDETNNTWAQGHFRDFLIGLLTTPGAPHTVNILAHSMGNRLAVFALDYLARSGTPTSGVIGQVVFAAPDVDSATFFEAVPRLAGVARGLTLYGSNHDEALRASRQLHGHCRAGIVGCDFAVPAVANFNAIDASIFHCDFLDHGYWNASSTMRADIAAVLEQGVNAPGHVRAHLTPGTVTQTYAFAELDQNDDACQAAALPF
jgi:alpha/beta hydrolase family protein DUF900